MDERRAGTLTGAAAYVLWGLLTLYWHELTGLNAFGLIGWRITWSVVVLGLALTITHRWADLRPVLRDRALCVRIVAASVALAVNWTTYVWCVTHGRVIETLGYFLSPIGLVVAGVVVYHEHLRPRKRAALSLAAVAVVARDRVRAPPVFALLMATTWTAYGMLKKSVPLPAREPRRWLSRQLPVAVRRTYLQAARSGPAAARLRDRRSRACRSLGGESACPRPSRGCSSATRRGGPRLAAGKQPVGSTSRLVSVTMPCGRGAVGRTARPERRGGTTPAGRARHGPA